MIHVGNALLGGHALQMGALAVLPVDRLAALVRGGFEKPARYRIVAGDHRRRLIAAEVAMDVDREPLAAGMRRSGKVPLVRRSGWTAGEEHRKPRSVCRHLFQRQ